MQRIEFKYVADTSSNSVKHSSPPPKQSFRSILKANQSEVSGRGKLETQRRKAGIVDFDECETREPVSGLITHGLQQRSLNCPLQSHELPLSAVQNFHLASFSRSPAEILLSFQICGLSQTALEVSFKLTGSGLSAAIVVRDERIFRRLNAKRKELARILKERGFIMEETEHFNYPNESKGGFRK